MTENTENRGYVYQWHMEDDFHELKMYLYLLQEDGKVTTLQTTFSPYFYVELPEGFLYPTNKSGMNISIETVESTVLRTLFGSLRDNLVRHMGYHFPQDCRQNKNNVDDDEYGTMWEEGGDGEEEEMKEQCKYCWRGKVTVEYKKKLYFVQRREMRPFLKISFPSLEQRRKCFYRINEKMLKVRQYQMLMRVHEFQAPPILQFCSTYSLSTVGWVKYNHHKYRAMTTTTSETKIIPIDASSLSIISEREDVLFPRICSFDIEVYSSNPKRMPQSDCPDDVIFQISLVFKEGSVGGNGNNNNTHESYLLTLGKVKPCKSFTTLEYENEKELLMGFRTVFLSKDPEVLMGYNIMGFDFPYMIKRCEMHHVDSTVFRLGKAFPSRVCPVKEISWSSSAYAHQHFFFWEMDGRVVLDILPMIRRDYKFASYSLKAVTTFFLGDTKDPVTPKDIFESYQSFLDHGSCEESCRKLTTVGKYCVQDSVLVWKLYEKLQLWIGLSEMAKICSVPMMSLFTQGQQIKVYSQVYRFCNENKILVEAPPPSLGKGDSYVGATVFPPEPGLYEDVIPFDFSSLYPTTMIAYNIDYSSCVPEDRTDISDELCHVIEWEEHVLCEHDMTRYTTATRPTQTLCGMRRYRFLKSPSGVLPSVLQFLLGARKDTKKLMKGHEEESLTYQVLDKRQLAYKVSANSMYGAMGVSKGYIPFLPGAMCTTARGRQSIQKASKFVQEQCHGKIIYGDSVSAYTPVWIRHSTTLKCKWMYVKDVVKYTEDHWDMEWVEQISQHSNDSNDLKYNKHYSTPCCEDIEVWTEQGWTQVKNLMKHVVAKRMFRILTNHGWVDVTEDHSLIREDGTACRPGEVKKGSRLMSTRYPRKSFQKTISLPLSFISFSKWSKLGFHIGYFLQWNSTCSHTCSSSYSLPLKTNLSKWEEQMVQLVEKNNDDAIYEVVCGFLRAASFHSMSSTFSLSLLMSDKDVMDRPLLVQLFLTLLEDYGWESEWEMTSTRLEWKIFQRCFTTNTTNPGNNENNISSFSSKRHCTVLAVLPLENLENLENFYKNNRMVYDFTTENHHFQAGVGSIVVHNTDSIYCHFPGVPFETLWNHAKTVEKEFVALFPPPMKLVFEEKIYKQFLILTKKRYMALTCDETLNLEDTHLTIRGVLLARRDNCAWVRRIYEQVVRRILAHETFEQVMTFLCECFYMLFSYQIPIPDFVVTKLVGKDYAVRPLPTDPDKLNKRLSELGISTSDQKWKELYTQKNQPAHVQLAEKIRQRGGESVEAGVRIAYVISRHEKGKKAKLFDKIEDPLYVMQRSPYVQIDTFYYGRLFETPMDQLMNICFKKGHLKTHTCKYVVSMHEQFQKCMEGIRQRDYTPLLFPLDVEGENEKGMMMLPVQKKKTSSSNMTKSTKTIKPNPPFLSVIISSSTQKSIYDYL